MMNHSDKGMPANEDAEKLILGSLILNDVIMHDVRTLIETDDFSLERHRRIWRAIVTLYDEGKRADRITVAEELIRRGELDSCGGLSYIVSLDDGIPQLPDIGGYARIVRDKALLRRIIIAADGLQQRCFRAVETPEEILSSFGDSVSNLAPQEAGKGLVSAQDLMGTVGLAELLAPRKQTGIPFAWSWMTDASCGLGAEELWVLAGGTSTGKTAAAIQQAVHVARRGFGVPIFSMEVGNKAVFRRAVIHMARVDKEKVDRGLCSKEERERLRAAADELCSLPIYFDDSGAQTCPGIHAALRRLKLKAQIGMIVVDYLQLLGSAGRHDSRAQEVGANARSLKMAAKDFGCPLLLLSQFNRDPGKDDRRPSLFDLKESGDIENHSNGVWFIHRSAKAETLNRGTEEEMVSVEFMLPKQRDGARDIAAPFYFFPRYQRFEMVGAPE